MWTSLLLLAFQGLSWATNWVAVRIIVHQLSNDFLTWLLCCDSHVLQIRVCMNQNSLSMCQCLWNPKGNIYLSTMSIQQKLLSPFQFINSPYEQYSSSLRNAHSMLWSARDEVVLQLAIVVFPCESLVDQFLIHMCNVIHFKIFKISICATTNIQKSIHNLNPHHARIVWPLRLPYLPHR